MADAEQDVDTVGDCTKNIDDPDTSARTKNRRKMKKSAFGASSFASSSSKIFNPFGSVLRPSQLKPGNNPFLKVTEPITSAEQNDVKEDRLLGSGSNKDAEAPKFVPLGTAIVTPRTTANPVPAPAQPAASSSSGFVFGQNLSERVVIKETVNNGEVVPTDHSSTNGTTELLFTSAAASVKENNQDEAGPSEASSGGAGLAAAAAEYERSHARPPPPTTNFNITGEEGEINVLQISCRLFAWESGSWRERGRGVLRLNDPAPGVSGATGGEGAAGGAARLVVRVAGSLRVVLNTKLWPDMVVQRAGTKSLRITASDAQQQVKLFLIMGAPADIVQLHRAMSARVATSKRNTDSTQNTTSQSAAERLEAATDENEFLEKHDSDVTSQEEGLASKPDAENHKTEDKQSHVDNGTDETKGIKRKEPTDADTPPKRQCPEIVID